MKLLQINLLSVGLVSAKQYAYYNGVISDERYSNFTTPAGGTPTLKVADKRCYQGSGGTKWIAQVGPNLTLEECASLCRATSEC